MGGDFTGVLGAFGTAKANQGSYVPDVEQSPSDLRLALRAPFRPGPRGGGADRTDVGAEDPVRSPPDRRHGSLIVPGRCGGADHLDAAAGDRGEDGRGSRFTIEIVWAEAIWGPRTMRMARKMN